MDTFRNPVYTQTNQGKLIHPSWENQRGILASHIIHVDSRVRDFDLFPNANHFKVKLPTNLHNVFSIELLNACIPIKPNVPLLVTDEHYLMLKIQEGSSGSIGVGEGALSTLGDNFSPLFDDSLAKIPLIENFSGTGFTFWRKDELRAIKYFEPRRSELSSLEITLEQIAAGGAFGSTILYPLVPVVPPITLIPNSSNDIKLTFEIVASN